MATPGRLTPQNSPPASAGLAVLGRLAGPPIERGVAATRAPANLSQPLENKGRVGGLQPVAWVRLVSDRPAVRFLRLPHGRRHISGACRGAGGGVFGNPIETGCVGRHRPPSSTTAHTGWATCVCRLAIGSATARRRHTRSGRRPAQYVRPPRRETCARGGTAGSRRFGVVVLCGARPADEGRPDRPRAQDLRPSWRKSPSRGAARAPGDGPTNRRPPPPALMNHRLIGRTGDRVRRGKRKQSTN